MRAITSHKWPRRWQQRSDFLDKSEHRKSCKLFFLFMFKCNRLQPNHCICEGEQSSWVLLWVSGVMALAWAGQAGFGTATSRVTSREIHPYPSQPPRLTSTTTACSAPLKHIAGLPRRKRPLKLAPDKAAFVSAPRSRRQTATRIDCTRG